MKKILLAINFQNECDVAIEDAYLLATKYQAAIIPIHAVEYLPRSNYQHEIDLLLRQIKERLKAISARLAVRGVEVFEPVIQQGDVLTVLSAGVKVIEADLLIIGAGVDDLNHKSLGVTAKAIIRALDIPVWVANGATEKVDYDNIVCAVDLSAPSLSTLESAVSLCRQLGAKLHVLHVEPKVTSYPGLLNSEIPVSPWVLGQAMVEMKSEEECRREHEQYVLTHDFKEFVKKVNMADIAVDVHVRSGPASREIMAFVALFSAGLLVMGSTGRSGFVSKLLGGTVEKVLNQLPCTMLCVTHRKK